MTMAKPLSLEQLTHRLSSTIRGENTVLSISALLAVLNAVLSSIAKAHPDIVRTSVVAIRNTCDKLEKLVDNKP